MTTPTRREIDRLLDLKRRGHEAGFEERPRDEKLMRLLDRKISRAYLRDFDATAKALVDALET